MTAFLIIGTIADALLAILLIALSGFVFGGGPEGMNGAPADAAVWIGGLVGCIAAPVLGFILRRRAKPGIGVLIAWMPPAVALFLSSGIFRPY